MANVLLKAKISELAARAEVVKLKIDQGKFWDG